MWLDRCFRHTRLGTIAPGRVLQPRLPERLVAFPEGLRLHTQRVRGSAEYFGLFVVPVRPIPILEAVLTDTGRVQSGEVQPIQPGAAPRLAPVTVPSSDGGGSTSVFAEGGRAVLTWSCETAVPAVLSLSLPHASDAAALPVVLAVDAVELPGAPQWDRIDGPGGVVARAPPAVVGPFTERARSGSIAEVTAGGGGTGAGGSTAKLRFPLDGLADELDALGCLQ